VGDNVGGLVGLALLAVGAIGGIAHGVMDGERFDVNPWLKRRKSGGGRTQSVYVPDLDMKLSRSEWQELIRAPGARARFGCLDTSVCPNGIASMSDRPGRYFVAMRTTQVATLSAVPPSLRANEFLERQVRPLTDKALFAANLRLPDVRLRERLTKNRARVDRLRESFGTLTLAAMAREDSTAIPPPTRMRRDAQFTPRPTS
jgi:hypothetical protein